MRKVQMKKASLLLSFLICCSFSIMATVPNGVTVFASQKEAGSISTVKKSYYTKTFEVMVANLSEKEFDLSKYCFKAFLGSREFKVDTIDENLHNKVLKNNENAKGMIVFASINRDITKAAMVKLTDNCK